MRRKNKVLEAGAHSHRDQAVVGDLMTEQVLTVTRQQTLAQARALMAKHGIHSIPVVNPKSEPIGIITTMDLIDPPSSDTPIGQRMTRRVFKVPRYAGLHVAARMMRNHGIHHLVVTDEQRVVGMISSFDLLKLVEDKRFVMKSLPSRPKKGGGRRRKDEDGAREPGAE